MGDKMTKLYNFVTKQVCKYKCWTKLTYLKNLQMFSFLAEIGGRWCKQRFTVHEYIENLTHYHDKTKTNKTKTSHNPWLN